MSGLVFAMGIMDCQVVRECTHTLISERTTVRPRPHAFPMLEAEGNSTSLSVARSFTSSEALPLSALAQRALGVLVEQHGACHEYLYWVEGESCRSAASLNEEVLDASVVGWLRQRVLEELADTTPAAPNGDVPALGARDLFVVGSRYYRLLLLFHPAAAGKEGLLGAAVVANDTREPTSASSGVLDAVADQLLRGMQRTVEDERSTTA